MSKQLPLKPSLEFDKKQAKALLKAFQSGKPSAIKRVQASLPHVHNQSLEQVQQYPLILTQAQLVVAREYGFQSWGSLRLEIKLRNHDYRAKLEQFKQAIYADDVQGVESLLSENVDLRESINDPLFSFDTPAILAAKHNLELVDVLIKYGADINAKSQWWAGAFHVLEGADSTLVNQLMERGASIIPHVAAEQGWLDWLINAYADNPEIVHQRGGDGKTPLHYATDTDLIDWLLEHGADINARDLDHNATPLQWQVSEKNWQTVRHLMAKGAQIDIFVAVALGDLELVKRALSEYPSAIAARVNEDGYPPVPPADGMHIYAYHFGVSATPHQVALHYEQSAIFDLLVQHSSIEAQFMAYCIKADETNARQILEAHPDIFEHLSLADKQSLAGAAWHHRTEVVRLMLKLSFDPHVRGAEESTPLDRAAFHGFDDVIEILLEYDKNPPLEWKNRFGGTPLDACVFGVKNSWHKDGDYVRSVDLLLKAGAQAQAKWMPSGNLQVDNLLRKSLGLDDQIVADTPFYQAVNAIINGDSKALKTIINQHPDLLKETSPEKHHAPLLFYVAANGVEDHLQHTPDNALEVLRLLLEAGINPDQLSDPSFYNKLKWTPLCLLVTSAHPARKGLQANLARLLIEHGAKVNGLDDDGLPLAGALAFGYFETARVLVELGARIDNLITSAALGKLNQVREFIESGEYGTFTEPFERQIESPEQMKELAFVYACSAGEMPVIRYLIEQGVNINSAPYQDLGLHKAAENGHMELVRYLVETGADLSAQDHQGFTALMWAAWNGNLAMMDYLLTKGSPLEIKNGYGGTALDLMVWATDERNYAHVDYAAVIRKLLEHGADIQAVENQQTDNEAVNVVLSDYRKA